MSSNLEFKSIANIIGQNVNKFNLCFFLKIPQMIYKSGNIFL